MENSMFSMFSLLNRKFETPQLGKIQILVIKELAYNGYFITKNGYQNVLNY